jgi:hypothetical protein
METNGKRDVGQKGKATHISKGLPVDSGEREKADVHSNSSKG